MPNYQNGKIYKLVNNVDDKIYVGSTTVQLAKRLYGHKADAKRKSNIKVYDHLNKIGWDNVAIILIENHACNTKEELIRRERYWYEELKPDLNGLYPGRQCKEYYQANKSIILQQEKTYRTNNQDHIKQRNKAFYEANKVAIIQRNKEYRDFKNECLIKCECGTMIKPSYKHEHEQTKKHTKLLEEIKKSDGIINGRFNQK